MELTHIIKRPLAFTEKSVILRETENQYLFEVDTRANKIEIRKAVESLFDVTVKDVRTLIVRGKTRRVGRKIVKKPNWKKAVVTLGEDDTIDAFEQF